MIKYHEFMMTSALVLSGAFFHVAAKLLATAGRYQQKAAVAERTKRFGYHAGNVIDVPLTRMPPSAAAGYAVPMPGYEHLGLLTPAEQEAVRQHENLHAMYQHVDERTQPKWTEADPCSDYDPIHPDYRP